MKYQCLFSEKEKKKSENYFKMSSATIFTQNAKRLYIAITKTKSTPTEDSNL